MSMSTRNGTASTVDELRELWTLLFPSIPPPDDAQWAIWLLRHDRSVVRRGLSELATKHKRLAGNMTPIHMGKFASAVMNRLTLHSTEERRMSHAPAA